MALRWRNKTKASLQPNPFTSSAPNITIGLFDLSLRSNTYSSGELETTEWCIEVYQPPGAVTTSITNLKLTHLNSLLQTKLIVTKDDEFYYINHEKTEVSIDDDEKFHAAIKFANYRYITQKKSVTLVLQSDEKKVGRPVIEIAKTNDTQATKAQSSELGAFRKESVKSSDSTSVHPTAPVFGGTFSTNLQDTNQSSGNVGLPRFLPRYNFFSGDSMNMVNENLRRGSALEIAKAMCSSIESQDQKTMLDARLNLMPHATKVENELFEQAKSRSDYNQLIVKKIHEIRKKHKEDGKKSNTPFSMLAEDTFQSVKVKTRPTFETVMFQLSKQFDSNWRLNRPGPSGIAAPRPGEQPTNEKQVESKTDDVGAESIQNRVKSFGTSSPRSPSILKNATNSGAVSKRKTPDNDTEDKVACQDLMRQFITKAESLEQKLSALDIKITVKQPVNEKQMEFKAGVVDELPQNRAKSPGTASSESSSSFEIVAEEVSSPAERSGNLAAMVKSSEEQKRKTYDSDTDDTDSDNEKTIWQIINRSRMPSPQKTGLSMLQKPFWKASDE